MSCPKLPNRIGFNFQSPLLYPINLQVQTIVLFDDWSGHGIAPVADYSFNDFGSIHTTPLQILCAKQFYDGACVRLRTADPQQLDQHSRGA